MSIQRYKLLVVLLFLPTIFGAYPSTTLAREIPEWITSIEQYVELARPLIIEGIDDEVTKPSFKAFQNKQSWKNVFDVKSDGNVLEYHVFATQLEGMLDKKKAIPMLRLNQQMTICGDKENWGVFDRGWKYRYKFFDAEKNFIFPADVTLEHCEKLSALSNQELLEHILVLTQRSIPLVNANGAGLVDIAFNDQGLLLVHDANLPDERSFQDLDHKTKEGITSYLRNLVAKDICFGPRYRLVLERGLAVGYRYIFKSGKTYKTFAWDIGMCRKYSASLK